MKDQSVPAGWKRLLPSALRRRLRKIRRVLKAHMALNKVTKYDKDVFLSSSSMNVNFADRQQLRSKIIAEYHKVEKGLALKRPRPGFGQAWLGNLLDNLGRYLDAYGPDDTTGWAISALREYRAFNRKHGVDLPWFDRALEELETQCNESAEDDGGTIEISWKESATVRELDFGTFAASRHSIRQFSDEPVNPELIRSAVKMAQFTPSVCNRQSVRVHVFRDPTVKKRMLELQGGNAGFGEDIDTVVAVTSDIRSFHSVTERNQYWVDGGMFAMSFIYALHSLGLGTCCLNWSRGVDEDVLAHQAGNIPSHEGIVMLIAVGNVPDAIKVARSSRSSPDAIIFEH